MKKFLTTILAFVYLSTSIGATIHLHYCMGKLASWGLIDQERNTCAHCGMLLKKTASPDASAKTNCCRDEHRRIKTGADQKLAPSALPDFSLFSFDIALHQQSTQVFRAISLPVDFPATKSPLLSERISRYLLYCNFRI